MVESLFFIQDGTLYTRTCDDFKTPVNYSQYTFCMIDSSEILCRKTPEEHPFCHNWEANGVVLPVTGTLDPNVFTMKVYATTRDHKVRLDNDCIEQYIRMVVLHKTRLLRKLTVNKF